VSVKPVTSNVKFINVIRKVIISRDFISIVAVSVKPFISNVLFINVIRIVLISSLY
jgi:hypothetical protein